MRPIHSSALNRECDSVEPGTERVSQACSPLGVTRRSLISIHLPGSVSDACIVSSQRLMNWPDRVVTLSR